MSDTEPVSIRILDRDYTVGVQPAQREGLLAAARLLEKRFHAGPCLSKRRLR